VPPPYPIVRARLDRALAEQDLAAFRKAAREFPDAVTLADGLQVLMLMLEIDDPAFDPAAVRWISRFTRECRGVVLTEVHAAVEALDGLPATDAGATLTALLKRHGRHARRKAEVSTELWVDKRAVPPVLLQPISGRRSMRAPGRD
jgi:hypothetical protein